MIHPDILFEDEYLTVINKPAGIVVNDSPTTAGQETIQSWMYKNHSDIFSQKLTDSDFYKRNGVVHRLDRETSGILLLAKTEIAFTNLQRMFKEKNVQKTYIALVHGVIKPTEGIINVPIGRLPWNRTKFGVLHDGRDALTRYKCLAVYEFNERKAMQQLSLIEAYPQTGRTHQIRVHFQYIGHPIFADNLYAGRKNKTRDRKILGRHFLHASKIVFNHPIEDNLITLHAPLPGALVAVLAQAQSHA